MLRRKVSKRPPRLPGTLGDPISSVREGMSQGQPRQQPSFRSSSLGAVIVKEFDEKIPCASVSFGMFSMQVHSQQHRDLTNKLEKVARQRAVEMCVPQSRFNSLVDVSGKGGFGQGNQRVKLATDHFLPDYESDFDGNQAHYLKTTEVSVGGIKNQRLRNNAHMRRVMGLEKEFRTKTKDY